MSVGHGGEEQVQQHGVARQMSRHARAGSGDPARTSPWPADAAVVQPPECVFGSCLGLRLREHGIALEPLAQVRRACATRQTTADRRRLWAWSPRRRPWWWRAGWVVRVGAAARTGCLVLLPRVRAGPGKCRVNATCVRDPAPGAAPDGRRGSSSRPGGGRTSGAVHGTQAGRTRASATKFLLRDHAPPQPWGSSVLVAAMGRGDGAHVAPRRAGIWPHRPDGVWPAAAPPASVGPGAGIRAPGSNAGSNAAAGTRRPQPLRRQMPRPRSSRTGTAAAVWLIMTTAHGSAISQGTARGERAIVLLGRLSKREADGASIYPAPEPDREGNGLRKAWPRRRPSATRRSPSAYTSVPEPDREGKRLERGMAKETVNQHAHSAFRLALFKCSRLALFFRSVPFGFMRMELAMGSGGNSRDVPDNSLTTL